MNNTSRLPELAVTEAVLPVLHEQLQVVKQLVETGGVRVRIEVDEVQQTLDLGTVLHEVDVQRVPKDTVVSEMLPPWQQGDVTVVPVYAERTVTTRQWVLVEELHLRPRQRTEPRSESIVLRQERAVIERQQGDGSWAPALPSTGKPGVDGTTP